MARTGRPRIPLEVKARDGKLRSRDGRQTPTLIGGRVTTMAAPTWMSAAQKRAFREIVKTQAAVLDAGDATMVEAAAVLLARARDVSRSITTLESSNGNGIDGPNPFLRIEKDAWAAYRQFAEQLGIGPSARARLSAVGVEGRRPEDEIDGLAEIVELRRAAQN